MSYTGILMRRGAFMMLAAALATLPGTAVAAQNAVTLDFNTLTETVPGSGTRFVNNCYMENGFVLTAVGLPCTGAAAANAFLAVGPNSPLFGGGNSPSMVLNTPDASEISLMRSNGGLFDLRSIALSSFFGAQMTNVLFTGSTMGGLVTQSFDVGTNFATYNFANNFMNLTAVRISAMNEFDEPLVNFDNIQLAVAVVVPEPTSIALVASGLFALTLVARRRRRA